MRNLPTRSDVELAPTIEHESWTALDVERVCEIVEAYANGELMTREEQYQSLDLDASIKHLEWLRGLRLSVGGMAEVVSAAFDGVYGGEDDESDLSN